MIYYYITGTSLRYVYIASRRKQRSCLCSVVFTRGDLVNDFRAGIEMSYFRSFSTTCAFVVSVQNVDTFTIVLQIRHDNASVES